MNEYFTGISFATKKLPTIYKEDPNHDFRLSKKIIYFITIIEIVKIFLTKITIFIFT